MNNPSELEHKNASCNPPESALTSKLAELEQKYSDLDNLLKALDFWPSEEDMAYKINRRVSLHGETFWIHANTEQEYAEKLIKLSIGGASGRTKHNFTDYAETWFNIFSAPHVETVTAITYRRQIDKYLIPHFENTAIEDISVEDVQRLFNKIPPNKTKATKNKIKQVLSMILDAAVEDGLLAKNPMRSKRLKITGKASKETQPYSVDQMRYIIQHIEKIVRPSDRIYTVLQSLHPLRLEEVLGLQYGDIDQETMTIHIRRAVTHPDRNQPEVKDTKTFVSKRDIALSSIALQYLNEGNKNDFICGGTKPLSYTQVRRMCERIQKDIDFPEKITPIRFRTTVLTDIYDLTKDIKLAQAAAGHTTSAMTLKHYVKGRKSADATTATVIDDTYGSLPA